MASESKQIEGEDVPVVDVSAINASKPMQLASDVYAYGMPATTPSQKEVLKAQILEEITRARESSCKGCAYEM